MDVPEAPVHEHHCFPGGEDEVRPAGQVLPVEAEAEADSMEMAPDLHLSGNSIAGS